MDDLLAHNTGAMIRALDMVGLDTPAKAVGHDKSWVSRVKNDEQPARMSDILQIIAAAGISLVVPQPDEITVSAARYRALCDLAKDALEQEIRKAV